MFYIQKQERDELVSLLLNAEKKMIISEIVWNPWILYKSNKSF